MKNVGEQPLSIEKAIENYIDLIDVNDHHPFKYLDYENDDWIMKLSITDYLCSYFFIDKRLSRHINAIEYLMDTPSYKPSTTSEEDELIITRSQIKTHKIDFESKYVVLKISASSQKVTIPEKMVASRQEWTGGGLLSSSTKVVTEWSKQKEHHITVYGTYEMLSRFRAELRYIFPKIKERLYLNDIFLNTYPKFRVK